MAESLFFFGSKVRMSIIVELKLAKKKQIKYTEKEESKSWAPLLSTEQLKAE